jgi:hypothetical protein
MSSRKDNAQEAINAIGGDRVITRLKARCIEGYDYGVRFYVPLLGGLVQVRVVRGAKCWDVELEFDVLATSPKVIKDVPADKLPLIIESLFVL